MAQYCLVSRLRVLADIIAGRDDLLQTRSVGSVPDIGRSFALYEFRLRLCETARVAVLPARVAHWPLRAVTDGDGPKTWHMAA